MTDSQTIMLDWFGLALGVAMLGYGVVFFVAALRDRTEGDDTPPKRRRTRRILLAALVPLSLYVIVSSGIELRDAYRMRELKEANAAGREALEKGRREAAAEHFRRAVEIARAIDPEGPWMVETLNNMAGIHLVADRHEHALELLNEAGTIARQCLDESQRHRGEIRLNRALTFRMMGDRHAALAAFEHWRDWLNRHRPEPDHNDKVALGMYIELLEEMGRKEKAKAIRKELERLEEHNRALQK